MNDLVILIAATFAIAAITILFVSQNRPDADLWKMYKIQFFIVAPVVAGLYFGGFIFLAVVALFCLRGGWEILEMRKYRPGLIGNLLFLLALCALMSSCILVARFGQVAANRELLLLVYMLVEVGDSFALIFGKSFGRTAVFKKLSPKKTMEGLVGGVIATLVAATCYSGFAGRFTVPQALSLAALVFLTALAGDLIVSAYKRWHGRKDFLAVNMMHGGVVDIYDSFLFVMLFLIPVGAYLGWVRL